LDNLFIVIPLVIPENVLMR